MSRMDSPTQENESSKKKKDEERSKPKGSLKRSFKWFMERGNKKKAPASRSIVDEDKEEDADSPTRSETPQDPDASGLDLFVQSPTAERSSRPDVSAGNSSGFVSNVRHRETDDGEGVRSTPSRKRLATRTLSITSSDSEVESNHLCGTGKKKSSEKGKGKKNKKKRSGDGRDKEERKRREKGALKRLQDEFSSDDDEDMVRVLRQFHKSPSGNGLASTSGAQSSSRDNNLVTTDDDDVDRPMEMNDDDDDNDNATIMVVKRGKKNGGRTGSTWPRQNEAQTSSASSLSPVGAAKGGTAATHPRGRCTRPGMPSSETRNLIKSPSQKSGVGNNNNNNNNNTNNNNGSTGGGDVEVRVRTTARGTSVSVLLPSASGSATAVDSNQPSARSVSSRDVRTGGGGSLQSSQTNTLQRRRHFSNIGGNGRRNSLPAAAHHSIHAPPPTGYSAAASSPDMTEESPPRRASVIQIDDDDDNEDDEEDDDDDEPVVEFERISAANTNRQEERSFPDVLEEPDDESRDESSSEGAMGGTNQTRSPDAVGVLDQIDDDERLARQLQEEFDREMASSMAREMEQGSDSNGARRDVGTNDFSEMTSFFQDGEMVPGAPPAGAPGPYYELASRRRRLSRVLANASSHVGAVSRAPPARRRAGSGALPLELSLGFGFGAPLGSVIGGDVDSDDVQAILDGNDDDDMDDTTNESSNDSDILFDDSQRGAGNRLGASTLFDVASQIRFRAARAASAASSRRAERRATSSSGARRGPQQSVSVRRGTRGPSTPAVHDDERNGEEDEQGNARGEESYSPHDSALNIASDSSSSGATQAPRRSRRLQRGPTAGLLSAVGGSSRSVSGTQSASTTAATTVSGPRTSLLSSSTLSTSLTDIVGVPLHGVTTTAQLSSSSTSVDRGPVAPSGPRGLLRGRLARAAMTSSTPALNTLEPSASTSTPRGPRPLSTSRSPTSRGPRSARNRPRAVSDSIDPESTRDTSAGSGTGTGAGESSVSCAACEAIQSRIQTYLEEVRTLQDTPVEGYDANFERMRVTTQLMRQTNDAMREWRNHTSQAPHHSLEERSHRLNTMSAIYRQISEIIQGAVRGLSPGTPLSSTRSRSRTSRASRENAPSTSSASTSSSRAARGQRYPGDATNPQFQFRRARAPSHLTPRLFIGQIPPGRLIPLANGWPADLDYEALLRLGDIMGEVVPQGLTQTQINRLPTHVFNAEKQKAASSSASSSVTEREDHKQCHVCLTEYDNGEQLRILPCFHRFHSACIDEWIKTNPTCPLCRVRVEFDD